MVVKKSKKKPFQLIFKIYTILQNEKNKSIKTSIEKKVKNMVRV